MKKILWTLLFIVTTAIAGPVLQMNRAFEALVDLIPYLSDEGKFRAKENKVVVEKSLRELDQAFTDAGHAPLLKEDLFAPSYALIKETIGQSLKAFTDGQTDYAHWRLHEITAQCLDCHTRLPPSYTSSFQNGELTINPSRLKDPYDLGLAQLIARRYVDAKESFTRSIQDQLIKNDQRKILLPFKQILLTGTKVQKDPGNLIAFFTDYKKNDKLLPAVKERLSVWLEDLAAWKKETVLQTGLKNDAEAEKFIRNRMKPLRNKTLFDGKHDVDLLLGSGVLSNYFFENPTSKLAPKLSFWLGWTELYLKREEFFGSGDLFLKQCVRRYPKDPVAKECLATYKDSVDFEFSGSSGTAIPSDIKAELKELEELVRKK